MSVETDLTYLYSVAESEADIRKLNEIKKQRNGIIKKNNIVRDTSTFSLSLDGLRFCMQKNLAPGTIDTYVEIFQKKRHMELPEFRGEANSIVLDVGANEGYYTLKMKSDNPMLTVIAVEPIPETYELLRRNLYLNSIHHVTVVPKALSDKNGTMLMETYPHISGISSENIMMQERSWLKSENITKRVVPCITLEQLVTEHNLCHIDLLKLDAEGSEYSILKSSQDLLPFIDKIVIEWHSDELKELCKNILFRQGFVLVSEDDYRFGDLYFKRTIDI